MNLIVPFAMEFVWFQYDGAHLGIRHFAARVIVIFVEPAMHLQPLIGASGVDEVHNNFVCLQFASSQGLQALDLQAILDRERIHSFLVKYADGKYADSGVERDFDSGEFILLLPPSERDATDRAVAMLENRLLRDLGLNVDVRRLAGVENEAMSSTLLKALAKQFDATLADVVLSVDGDDCDVVIDDAISKMARRLQATFTRYADDIVISGIGKPPDTLRSEIEQIFRPTTWRIAEHKTRLVTAGDRMKVHGLLVHEEKPRLTKGYRRRIRAIRHLHEGGKIPESELASALGHLAYAESVENFGKEQASR